MFLFCLAVKMNDAIECKKKIEETKFIRCVQM